MNRDFGIPKISVHASGQIHYRPTPRDVQLLAPALPLPDTPWQAALQIRFLITANRTHQRLTKSLRGAKRRASYRSGTAKC